MGNEMQCLQHIKSDVISMERKIKIVALDDDEKKMSDDDEENENVSDAEDESAEDLVSYELECFVIERKKVYELDFYRNDNELFYDAINDVDSDKMASYKEKILDVTRVRNWYRSSDIILSMNTFKMYGGCCIASDRIMKFKDIVRPFTNCIVIWNQTLVSKLLACGTYNLPTAII